MRLCASAASSRSQPTPPATSRCSKASRPGGGAYKVSGGLHGVGASVVNALASKMYVEVRREGKVYRQEYERGLPTTALKVTHDKNQQHTGTTASYLADDTIFDSLEYDYDILLQRFREMAYLTKGIWIRFE